MSKAGEKSTSRKSGNKVNARRELHDAIEFGRLVALPFVSPTGASRWSVKPTGDRIADRELAREYALAYLDYALARKVYRGHPGSIGIILRDMARAGFSHIAQEFLETMFNVLVQCATHEHVAAQRHAEALSDKSVFDRAAREKGGAA